MAGYRCLTQGVDFGHDGCGQRLFVPRDLDIYNMPRSDPLLPADYIQNVLSHEMMQDFESSIFNSDSHDFRVSMRNWIKPLSPDSSFSVREQEYADGFTDEAKRTYLHFHAKEGDVLSVSEMITFGATPSVADNDGKTPLHLVAHEMAMVKSPRVTVLKADGSGITHKGRLYARLAWVLRILVEHHANVNIIIDDDSLLNLSCVWKDWDIITLLLKHGATPSPGSVYRFTSPSDQKRFSDLVKSFKTRSRPPRICPCWSGKIVRECHGKSSLPYPLKYMCVCGSLKKYKLCCHKRGKFVSEKWDHKTQRNLLTYDNVRPIPPNAVTAQHELAVELLKKGLIDAAFAYAMGKTEFVPMYVIINLLVKLLSNLNTRTRPHGRTTSRSIRHDMQTVWNQHIDDYISQGKDPRQREEIERAAKIGSGNGALFRVCNGDQCTKVESREAKFSFCAKCKTVRVLHIPSSYAVINSTFLSDGLLL
jgi:hypothetical protein